VAVSKSSASPKAPIGFYRPKIIARERDRIDRPSDRRADGLPDAMAAARMRANGRSRMGGRSSSLSRSADRRSEVGSSTL